MTTQTRSHSAFALRALRNRCDRFHDVTLGRVGDEGYRPFETYAGRV